MWLIYNIMLVSLSQHSDLVIYYSRLLKILSLDFTGGPVAKDCATSAGGRGSTPGQGPRSHMLQLRACMPQ